MSTMFDRPSSGALVREIARAASYGLLANTMVIAIGYMLANAPASWFSIAAQRTDYARCSGPLCTEAGIVSAIWMGCAFLSLAFDLVLHYRSIHHASLDFRYAARVSREMATKILGLDLRGADDEKKKAKYVLEGTRIDCIGGFFIQLFVGLPSFVIASVGPWLLLPRLTILDAWLFASLLAIKFPAVALATVDLCTIAIHTWSCRTAT